MEKKVNRYLRWIGLASFMGYFVGTTIYVLMGGNDDFKHAMSGLAGALLLALVMSIYTHFRNPELKVKMIQLKNDERSIAIEGKAAKIALYSVCVVLVLISGYGVYIGNLWLHYGSIVIVLVIYTGYQILRMIYNRKM